MNEPSDPDHPDDLDRLLQAWSARQETSPQHLAALYARVVAQLTQESAPNVSPKSTAPGGRTGWLRPSYAWLVAAVALVLLVAASVVWFGPRRPHRAPEVANSPRDLPADDLWLREDQLRNKARLLAEMEALFDGQLQWLAETNDRVELGLTKDSTAASDQPALVARVVVQRRTGADSVWAVVWAADVVALNEQRVDLRPLNGANAATLFLWVYRLPDGMIFVDSRLGLAGSETIRFSSSNLLVDNRPTEVATLQADGAEYRVFQTVAALGRGKPVEHGT